MIIFIYILIYNMTKRTKKIIRGNSKRNDKTLKKKKRSKINKRRLNSNRKKIYKRSAHRKNKRTKRRRTKRRRTGNFNRKKKKIQNGGFIPLLLVAIKIIASSQASKDAMQNFINYLLSHIFKEDDFALLDDDYVNDIQLATNISKGIIHNVSYLLQGPHGLLELFKNIMVFLRNFVVNSFLNYLVENLSDVIDVISDEATELQDKCLNLISRFFAAEDATFSSENLKEAISSGLQLQTAAAFAEEITVKWGTIYTDGGGEEEKKLKIIVDTVEEIYAVLEGPGSIKKKITQKLFELMKMDAKSICVHLFESFSESLEKRGEAEAISNQQKDGPPDYDTIRQGIKLQSLLRNKLHSAEKSISISDEHVVNFTNLLSIAACQTEFNELIARLSEGPEPEMGEDLELEPEPDTGDDPPEPTPVVELQEVKLSRVCYEVGWLHDVKQGVNHIDYIGGVESLLDRKEEHMPRDIPDYDALFSVSVFLQVMGNNPCEHIGAAKSMLFGEEFIYDFNDNHETHVGDLVAGMLVPGAAAAPMADSPQRARLRRAVGQVIAANSQRPDLTQRYLKGIKIDSLTGRICFASIIENANIFYHENKCYCRGWFPFVEEKWAEYRRHYEHIYEELERIEWFVELFIRSQFYLKYDIKASIVGQADQEIITVSALGKEYQVDTATGDVIDLSDPDTVVGRWHAKSTSIIFPTMDEGQKELVERFYEMYENPPGPPDPDPDSDPPGPPDPSDPGPDSFQKFIELYVRLLSFMKLMCMFIFYHRKWNSGVRNEYKVKYLLAYIQKSLTEADGAMAARAQREPVPTERLITKVRPAFGQLEENRTLTNLIVNHGLSGLLGDDNCFDIVRVRLNPKPTDLDSLKTLFGGSPGQLAKPGPNILYDLLSDGDWQSYKVYKMVTCSGDDFTVSIFPAGTSPPDMRAVFGGPAAAVGGHLGRQQINLLDLGTSWNLDLRLAAEDPDYIEGLELSGDGNHKLIVTFQTLREPPHSHRELESELLKVGDSLLWMEYDDDEDLSSWPEASQLSSILLGEDGEFERILYHEVIDED
jgi:hypothetical protein